MCACGCVSVYVPVGGGEGRGGKLTRAGDIGRLRDTTENGGRSWSGVIRQKLKLAELGRKTAVSG